MSDPEERPSLLPARLLRRIGRLGGIAATADIAPAYSANIENMIGLMALPVGAVGPLRINGLHAAGSFIVPLATTEAALVASCARGADVIMRS